MRKLLIILLCSPIIVFGQNLAVGDTYEGGIIFYLDGNGGGLIAAPTDQATVNDFPDWGCIGTAISGADGLILGTGAQNTIDIENGCITSGTAADICSNLVLDGFSDWFLPSIGELEIMYLNIGTGSNIGNFVSTKYWSSTEKDETYAWSWEFSSGYQDYNSKTSNKYVRAIRAFSNITNINKQQISIEKKIIKIFDVFGRESNNKNQPLFYFYDDGSVEKKIIIE
ncbi:MAG: hypothetical protein CMJ05_10200 [Pelagibacterales bacterium]|nr:hypothetical protein [Pelagibacterales bacterium]